MVLRAFMLSWMALAPLLAQDLPDRDELTTKFLNPATTNEAMRDLMFHFQLGGIRTIIRNLNELPEDKRESVAMALIHMDLFRFLNDLNANVINAPDNHAKALGLMLLATHGDQLADETFLPHAKDESLPLFVRLAAAGGLVQRQDIGHYMFFFELSKEAEFDPATGKNDFKFASLTHKNLGFSAYARGRLDAQESRLVDEKYLIPAILCTGPGDTDVFTYLAERKAKDYVPAMIDQAIRVGGVDLLDAITDVKYMRKRFDDDIAKAKSAIQAMQAARAKVKVVGDADGFPVGALLPSGINGAGSAGYRSAYAVVKVDAEGNMSVESLQQPFAGSHNLNELFSGKTLPAHVNWKPVESHYLVYAP